MNVKCKRKHPLTNFDTLIGPEKLFFDKWARNERARKRRLIMKDWQKKNKMARTALPLELNCEVFDFLDIPAQKRLISLSRGISRIFQTGLGDKVFAWEQKYEKAVAKVFDPYWIRRRLADEKWTYTSMENAVSKLNEYTDWARKAVREVDMENAEKFLAGHKKRSWEIADTFIYHCTDNGVPLFLRKYKFQATRVLYERERLPLAIQRERAHVTPSFERRLISFVNQRCEIILQKWPFVITKAKEFLIAMNRWEHFSARLDLKLREIEQREGRKLKLCICYFD